MSTLSTAAENCIHSRSSLHASLKRHENVCGSEPYIPPEEWVQNSNYDPTKADVWSCGIILYTMLYMSVPWGCSRETDTQFQIYVAKRRHPGLGCAHGFQPVDRITPATRNLLYRCLDPNPETRPAVDDIITDAWIESIECCTKGKGTYRMPYNIGTNVRTETKRKGRVATLIQRSPSNLKVNIKSRQFITSQQKHKTHHF
ncbi:kinase-like domain-containing protein [Cladochytrium replicatum]|nr:kinase-like domain-containing protein [Cladochytrium replicatum]